MQKPRPFLVLAVALSCVFLLPSCSPVAEGLSSENSFTGIHIRSRLPVKISPNPNNLPRLPFTSIPDVIIVLDNISWRRRPWRPLYKGISKSVSTEHFRIHFTTIGTNAVSRTDGNNNSIPDYVEEVAKAMEYIWEVEISYFGWPAPPADGGLGGDERYDVYLQELSTREVIGYAPGARGENSLVGDNPNTPNIIEEHSAYSYISLDNNYQESSGSITGLDLMRETAAHEFLHAIQHGLDSQEPMYWLWEATATWMEEEVFDGIGYAGSWLDTVLESPDSCLAANNDSEENRWYGQWIYPRYLSENYGHSIVQDLWYSAVHVDGYNIIETTLEKRYLNPEVVFQDFLIALLTLDFDEGNKYPTVSLEGKVRSGDTFSPPDGVDKLGADYIEILSRGKLTITLKSDQLDGIVVGIAGDQSAIFSMADGTVSVDANDYDNLYLIVINHNEVSFDYQCEMLDYQVEVNRGGEVQYQPLMRPAPNFRQP